MIDLINEIMEMYTEITNITTICFDSFNNKQPLFSKGLDITLLIKYTDFEEIISYVNSELKKETSISKNPNTFHTFTTKNFFVYNIVFEKIKKNRLALVAGPILSFLPDNKAMKNILKNNGLPLYKKYEFIEILSNLPLASNERIYQLGKLLLQLDKTGTKKWNTSKQEFHGIIKIEDRLYVKYLKESISSGYEYDEIHAFYRFCANLRDNITHGKVNGIIDIIGEFAYLFWDMESKEDNNRSLKNKTIILCSIACQYAVQSNVPYEQMFSSFWKSILKLEKLKATEDIIVHMAVTIEGFAHAVFNLSDNGYSLHINRVLQYINGHFTEKITLKELAEHINVNAIYLSSLIKKETNMSLSSHINLIRIKESKKLLIYTNKSVQEIAYEVGYNYQNHFNTVFKKIEGISPLEFRKTKGSMNMI